MKNCDQTACEYVNALTCIEEEICRLWSLYYVYKMESYWCNRLVLDTYGIVRVYREWSPKSQNKKDNDWGPYNKHVCIKIVFFFFIDRQSK